jgi:hypothetical protein
MARSLSSPTGAAVGAIVTQPAYLIQINWSTVSRLTTGATLTWGGYSWLSESVALSGLQWGKDGLQSATLRLGNNDQRYSALALNEGVADVPIVVYAYDQAATAAGDPVKVFEGVGGKVDLNDDTVTITLRTAKARALTCPRTRVSPANGFNHLPPRGTVIMWGTQRYVLEGR